MTRRLAPTFEICAFCRSRYSPTRRGVQKFCGRSCRSHARTDRSRPLDWILSRDTWAVAAARQAVALIVDGHDDGADAYICCRLAAVPILERYPGIKATPRGLAVYMLQTAATAALLMMPTPRRDN